jgi:hypothetical protein
MTKNEVAQYVADMAWQLADLCRAYLPIVARVLEVAADLARDALQRTR